MSAPRINNLVDASLLRASIIKVTAGSRIEDVLVIYLVGVLGDTKADHFYNVTGMAIDFRHNLAHPIRRLQSYIDDGIMMNPEGAIASCLCDYRNEIHSIYGPDSTENKKCFEHGFDLQAIGFLFNLRRGVWRVGPKRRGLLKMYTAALFYLRHEEVPCYRL